MKNHTKFTALITTTLLTVALAGPANATGPEPQGPTVETASMPVLAPITANPTASVAFEKPTVKSVAYVAPVAAPVVVASAPVAQTPAVKATPTTQTAPAAVKAAPAAVKAAPAAAVPVAGSGKGAALLASAYSQIGIRQDCTAMVERALGTIGIVTGDIGPNAFFRFGTVVSNPLPGDIMISAGHVGIYAGNGQMISGGFNNLQTVLHPISYVGAASYVRVA